MFKVSIPEISDSELLRRYAHIRPIIHTDDDKRYWLKPYTTHQLRGQSFIWEAKDRDAEVGPEDLDDVPTQDFRCLHAYGYYGLFKPSVAEVLAQIDENVEPLVAAFEIIDSPKAAADFRKDDLSSIAFDQGYHVSTIRLYLRH